MWSSNILETGESWVQNFETTLRSKDRPYHKLINGAGHIPLTQALRRQRERQVGPCALRPAWSKPTGASQQWVKLTAGELTPPLASWSTGRVGPAHFRSCDEPAPKVCVGKLALPLTSPVVVQTREKYPYPLAPHYLQQVGDLVLGS